MVYEGESPALVWTCVAETGKLRGEQMSASAEPEEHQEAVA